MSRISRHQMWMLMAKAAAMRSTCYRLNVGCVIVNRQNIVSIGYNGAPAGQDHCTGNGCQYFAEAGCRVIHAEANAIIRAQQKNKYDLVDAFLYTTHSPCHSCVDIIKGKNPLNVPISLKAVIYETEYRDRTPVDRLICETQIGVYRVTPSGFLIDLRTGCLIADLHA